MVVVPGVVQWLLETLVSRVVSSPSERHLTCGRKEPGRSYPAIYRPVLQMDSGRLWTASFPGRESSSEGDGRLPAVLARPTRGTPVAPLLPSQPRKGKEQKRQGRATKGRCRRAATGDLDVAGRAHATRRRRPNLTLQKRGRTEIEEETGQIRPTFGRRRPTSGDSGGTRRRPPTVLGGQPVELHRPPAVRQASGGGEAHDARAVILGPGFLISSFLPPAIARSPASPPPPLLCLQPSSYFEEVENELQCLCDVYRRPSIFRSFNINATRALEIPGLCGVSLAT
ncbi:hypothetical protein EJ110_NYTH29545 [Nymphaea thermarum]|nr:hypothetical protein EJ110_NYTH29545 [Nymphaea thermarum]